MGQAVIKNIWRIGTDTLRDLCGIVEAAGMDDQQAAIRQLHGELLEEFKERDTEAE